jgi:hypothetical protein
MNKLELSSLYQLTMVRFRLFLREPEAIFWIFFSHFAGAWDWGLRSATGRRMCCRWARRRRN